MNAIKIASYLVALAMAALGLWLSSQRTQDQAHVGAPPPTLSVPLHETPREAPDEAR